MTSVLTLKAGKKIVHYPEVIYGRAIVLRHINPRSDFEKLLVNESALYPTSMVNEKGAMRSCNQKSKLYDRVGGRSIS